MYTVTTYFKKHWVQICLMAILVLSFVLRIWGIDFGLPYKHYIDEEGQVYAALYAGFAYLKPFRYMYASFVPYLLLLEYGAVYLIGLLQGAYFEPFDLLVSYVRDPTLFFLLGRFTMGLSGTLSVYVIWLIGQRFFSKTIGLVSAFFMSVIFLLVKESHYIKQDVISTFFLLLTLYFCLVSVTERRTRHFFLTGIFLAIAISAKYQIALIIPVLGLVYLLYFKRVRMIHIFLLSCVFFISMIVLNPYYIFKPYEVIHGTLSEIDIAKTTYPELLQGKPVWWWFLFRHIPDGLGISLFITSMIGFVLCLWRSRLQKIYAVVPLLPIIFLLTVDQWSQFPSARYSVMLMPFFAVSASIVVESIASLIKQKHNKIIFTLLFTLVLGGQSLVRSVQFNQLLTLEDSRVVGKNWIEKNISKGSKVLVEATVRPEYPSNLNVPLNLSYESLERIQKDADTRNIQTPYIKALKMNTTHTIGYDIKSTTGVNVYTDINTDTKTKLLSPDKWIETNTEYIVLSSWAIKPDLTQSFIDELILSYDLIYEIRPTYVFISDPHLVRMDFEALDRMPLIVPQDALFGPIISVYKLKDNRYIAHR